MNRSSLRFAHNALPTLHDLAAWLDHQDGNRVLGLSLSAPSEDTLQAEDRNPLARPSVDRVVPHSQMVRSLARLKNPLVKPVYEALCQALSSLDHDFSLETIARFMALANTLDEALLGQASARSLTHIDPDLLDEFQLLPDVWPVFKQRYEQRYEQLAPR